MLKKVTSLCLIFCMVFTGYIHAKDNSISSETIITGDNIYEVLEYLDIDSSNFIKDNVEGTNTRTVGDLEKAIKQAQKLPKNKTITKDISSKNNNNEIFNNEYTPKWITPMASGAKMLYRETDLDGYILEYQVAGQYSNRKWIGVGSAGVDIDSPDLIMVRKIDSKDLNASYTDTVITLKAKVVVGVYLGVGDFGFIRTDEQTVNSTLKWYASSEL